LCDVLIDFRGAGLIVSHDRELLDMLCSQCVFLDPPGVVLRPGGFTDGFREAQREAVAAERQGAVVKKHFAKIKRETSRRRHAAAQADRKRSKRGLSTKDHDARDKLNRARNTGRDAVAGKLLRQLDGRLKQAEAAARAADGAKTHELGIWMAGAQSRRRVLFDLEASSLPLGQERRLVFPRLTMRPDQRIGLIGPNGCGKSTLVRHILDHLRLDSTRLTYLPQEIDLEATASIIEQLRGLPKDELGRAMAVVSRLNSRPDRLLSSEDPTPGEIRKVLVALGIARVPHLIVMDEPTNHMDLPSIECLEEALAGCPCGLLLVSHDHRFLDRLVTTCWELAPDGSDCVLRHHPWDGTDTV
jgi:ATPase subunit of ABC transporter with duplicated ATPase domains